MRLAVERKPQLINADVMRSVIFFPQDTHQPGVAEKGSMPVRKFVMKVLV